MSSKSGDVFVEIIAGFTELGAKTKRSRFMSDREKREHEDAMRLHWNALASETFRNLHALKILPVPRMPAELPDSFEDLHSKLVQARRRLERMAKPTKEDFLIRTTFGEWRDRVAVTEERNAATVETVLRAAGILRELGDDVRATQLIEWVRSNTGCERLPETFEWRNLLELRRISRAVTRRHDIMPSWLLNGREPRSHFVASNWR